MSNYLSRLKQLDEVKFSYSTPKTLLTKLTEGGCVSFVSSHVGHIEKKIIAASPEPPLAANPIYDVFDWNALTEPEAFIALCDRIGVSLRVDPDGTLKATGNTKAAKPYIADIAARYRGAVIAHLLNLPLPEISDEQDRKNIGANYPALDITIAEYCAAVGHTVEHREKLLTVRRSMAAYLLVQNLCAFRAWLYVAKGGGNG